MFSQRSRMFVLRTIFAVPMVFQLNGQEASSAERNFVKDALASTRKEIAIADVAMSQATDPMIKAFARMVVNEHTKSNTILEEIARKKKIETSVPAEFDTRLAALKGPEFDQALVKKIVDSHTDDLERYKLAEKDIADPDIHDFIVATLPMLQSHLDQAKALVKEEKSSEK